MTSAGTRALLGLVAGWLLGQLVSPSRPEAGPAPPRCTLAVDALPPRPPSTRAWRSVPGVGRRRALSLARAYWTDGDAFEAERVPGVGPITGAAVRRFLARGGTEAAYSPSLGGGAGAPPSPDPGPHPRVAPPDGRPYTPSRSSP